MGFELPNQTLRFRGSMSLIENCESLYESFYDIHESLIGKTDSCMMPLSQINTNQYIFETQNEYTESRGNTKRCVRKLRFSLFPCWCGLSNSC